MGKTFDVAIVGGGVVGLWVARHAIKAGLDVVLVDKARCGAGASGTVLGALLPHLPRVMSAKKIFQFEALAELSSLIDELEAETGLDAGYTRCGRIMPIRTARYLEHAKVACAGSLTGWHNKTTGFEVSVRDADTLSHWIDGELAPLGIIHDSLSARILTEKYIAALKASLIDHATVIEGTEITGIDTTTRQLRTPTGPAQFSAKKVVLTAGYETFPLLQRMNGPTLGQGIKGQAAVFEIEPQPTPPPVIYDNGVYVVPHGRDRCAVGSTSEEIFNDPTTADPEKAVPFIERARELCPPLRNGRLLHHWAGVRPRCTAKDPIVGCIDQDNEIHIATGGFKITLGIAHRMARRLVEELTGAETKTVVPETYEVAHHLNAARP